MDEEVMNMNHLTVALALVLGIVVLVLSTWAKSEPLDTKSFWDGAGHFAGSSSRLNNSTSYSDRDGHFSGSSIRNSDGTTSLYDRNGHFTGSVTNTSPQRGGRGK